MSRHVRVPRAQQNFYKQVRQYQGELLMEALRLTEGNQSEAARHLGITRSSFVGMLNRIEPRRAPTISVPHVAHGYAVLRTQQRRPSLFLIWTCWTRADMLKAMRDRNLVGIFTTHVNALAHVRALTDRDSTYDVRPDSVRKHDGGYPALRIANGPTR